MFTMYENGSRIVCLVYIHKHIHTCVIDCIEEFDFSFKNFSNTPKSREICPKKYTFFLFAHVEPRRFVSAIRNDK